MAGPFASKPTGYEVRGAKVTWWANCAWDMYGVAHLVNEPVTLTATCADCGEQLSATGDFAALRQLPGVVHFLVPAREWYKDVGFT
jgi:hypothetical protein